MDNMKCPFCSGTGEAVKTGSYRNSLKDMKTAYELRQKGVSYREICKIVEKDHPQKVKHMIEKYHDYLIEKEEINS